MSNGKRYVIYFVLGVWALICLGIIIKNFDRYSFGDNIVVIGMAIFPMAIMYLHHLSKLRQQAYIEKKNNELIEKENEKINKLNDGLPILDIPSLFFADANVHYFEPASLLDTKNKMVGLINESKNYGYERPSLIFENVNVTKSSSYGSSQAIYNDITYRYNGNLAITSKGIVFINQEKGFELKLNEIAFMQEFSDGVSIQHDNNVYKILLKEPRYFMAVIKHVRNDFQS